ncbi:MAG: type VI secretion protein ImpB [Novosphingobium sp.]|nr:type VI secretion protein ImpB [Novosphingobium sp.]
MRRPAWPERLYVDFDSFFASAEQYLEPALRGRPVGVLPVDSPNTGLIAASVEAKRAGVRSVMRRSEAEEACPGIVLRVARPDVYVALHHRIRACLEAHVEVLAVRSIDEAVARLMANEAARARDLGDAIKRDFAATFAPCLSLSIGIAANELLAKIAAEMDKPDGLRVLLPENMPDALAHLPLRDIPGISTGMEKRLHDAGVRDFCGLWALAPKQARKLWGGVQGERFVAALHGFAVEQPVTQKRMFGHGRVLPPDWRSPERMLVCARVLLVKAARRLRREGYLASSLTFSVRPHEGGGLAVTRRFPSARDDHRFLAELDMAFVAWRANAPPGKTRSVSVTLHGLTLLSQRQGDLFAEFPDGSAERWERVSDLTDTLQARFGGQSLRLGEAPELPGGYAGGKIAFGRIPHELDFL